MLKYRRRCDVSIVVPYRNREQHLNLWNKFVADALGDMVEILLVEQIDTLPFNRGCLLNIGFNHCTGERVIFHDVDLVPDHQLLQQYCSPWPAAVVHFGARFSRYNNTKSYFGGVTGFFRDAFPGFPNKFWGWGGEDDVLYKRTQTRIHRPSKGCYTDLEFIKTAKQKSKSLRPCEKCCNRWELKASDNRRRDNHLHIPQNIRFSYRLHSAAKNRKTIEVFFY